MTITLNTTSSYASNGSGHIVFNKPSVSIGDVLLVFICGSSDALPVAPSGWVNVLGARSSGSVAQEQGYIRAIDGTEGSSFSFTTTGITSPTGYLMAFSGVDNSFPVDLTHLTNTFSTTSVTNSGITTRVANDYIMGICGVDTFPNPGATVSSGTGTQVAQFNSGNFGFNIRQTGIQASTASTGNWNWTWTQSSNEVVSIVFGLRPAGGDIPPAVSVGADQYMVYGDTFTLTATGSDVEGPITYAWNIQSQPSANTAVLQNPNTATITFHPTVPGVYDLQCVVTDSNGATSSDDMLLTCRAEIWTRVSGVAKAGQRRIRKNGALY